MVNLSYLISLGIVIAVVVGAPLDGSHRSAPANPSLYYRTDDSSDQLESLSLDGSHRSAPLRVSPSEYDVAARNAPTSNVHTGPEDTRVWRQVWER
ncbi:unnamed protein product [Meganyctiphanes norvegica]|uniref:Secreted protein n=1 Tax=Meganyctiphanes norvegica TaxID=48144 RepID=A0AAV2RZQ7_MEGNR